MAPCEGSGSVVLVEGLEGRRLFAATPLTHVIGAYLDNRGGATFTFDAALNPATATKGVSAYLAGKDGKLGTKDDVKLKVGASYEARVITVSVPVTKDTPYRVVLDGKVIKDAKGKGIDGEVNAKGVNKKSGDGKVGGNFDVSANVPATTAAPVYRFTMRYAGVTQYVNVKMFTDVAATVANFQGYADETWYDSTFIHRSTLDSNGGIQVIQGGGYGYSGGAVGSVPEKSPVALELKHSNVKGTIAMARDTDVNSATSQWYFNVNDNTALDTFGGGYAVFGQVTDAASQKVIEAINALPIRQADPGNPNSPFNELPAASKSGTLKIPKDLVMVNRVARVMDVAKTPLVAKK